jgi:hypothetical protein
MRDVSADKVADHHESGRDPDPHLQGRADICGELRNGLNKRESGPHRALRIMLMRLIMRVAEIGETPSPIYLATKPPLRSTSSVQQ